MIFLLLELNIMAQTEVIKFKTIDHISLVGKYYKPDMNIDNSIAVLIIEGSGKSGMDKDPDSSPFVQLGQELAKNGFHVLTYNKRGSCDNSKNGSFWKATFSSDNEDAISALSFLKSRVLPMPKKIFLIGHSFGGPHSLVLGTKDNIDGIVMLTSTIRYTGDLQMEQTKIILELTGQKSDVINTELQTLKLQIDEVKSGKFKCEKPQCEIIDGVETVDHSIQVPWWKEVLNLDFSKIAQNSKARIHFIFGTSDFVIPESDQTFVEKIIREKKLKHISITQLEKLDHFMVENDNKIESLKYAKNAQATQQFKLISGKLISDIVKFFKEIN
jgi:esterase/lipase